MAFELEPALSGIGQKSWVLSFQGDEVSAPRRRNFGALNLRPLRHFGQSERSPRSPPRGLRPRLGRARLFHDDRPGSGPPRNLPASGGGPSAETPRQVGEARSQGDPAFGTKQEQGHRITVSSWKVQLVTVRYVKARCSPQW